MKKKRKLAIVFLFIVIATFLTGCKGEKIKEDVVTWEYKKRIERIDVINSHDDEICIDFNVVLLDKDKVILFKEKYDDITLYGEESEKVNLESVKPEYISYDKIDSMEIEILEVYSYSTSSLIVLIVIGIVLGIAFIIWIICIIVEHWY